MLTPLRRIPEQLRASLWFVPTLIVSGAVILAIGLVEAEGLVGTVRLGQELAAAVRRRCGGRRAGCSRASPAR